MNVIKAAALVGGTTLAARAAGRMLGSEDGMTTLVRLLGRPVLSRAARSAIVGRLRVPGDASKGRLTRAEVDRLLSDAWTRYDAEVSALAPQPTLGSRVNLRLALLTHAFLDAFLAKGVERRYAVELIADASWKVYEIWGRIGGAVARLRPGGRRTLVFGRTRPDGTFSLTFPFEPPGYLTRLVLVPQGVGFDVLRCPIADYFRARGEADLCRAAWCDLDYALGDLSGQRLRRTQTLVEGADFCDFRVRSPELHPTTTSH